MKVKWLTGFLPVLLILCMCFAACESEVEKIVYRDRPDNWGQAPVFTPGSQTATAMGAHNDVQVTVVFSKNSMESITVPTTGNNENSNVGRPAMNVVIGLILEHQTTNVDVVAGATMSSMAVMEGVRKCIILAGGNDKMCSWDATTTPILIRGKPEDFNPDVIVVGGGLGGIMAAMSIADQGGKALILEQAPHIGGSSRFAAGAFMTVDAKFLTDPSLNDREIAGGTTNVYPLATSTRWNEWLTHENYTKAPIGDKEHDGKTDLTNNPVPGFEPTVSAAYVNALGKATDKLKDWGMVIWNSGGYTPASFWHHDATDYTSFVFGRQGHALINDITPKMNRFINTGLIGIVLNSKVVDLNQEGDKINGVKLVNGKVYKAGAVILASGGFVLNQNLMKRPEKPYDPVTGITETGGGLGISYYTVSCSETDIGNMSEVMIDKYEATAYRLDQCRFDGGVVPYLPIAAPRDITFGPYAHGRIFLSTSGKRLGNESLNVGGSSHAREQFELWDMYRQAPDNLIYTIGMVNRSITNAGVISDGSGNGRPSFSAQSMASPALQPWDHVNAGTGTFEWMKEYIWVSNGGGASPFTTTQTADQAIRELATKAGLDPDVVSAEFAKYDAECDEAEADILANGLAGATYTGTFSKPARGLRKMTPPFWMVVNSGHVKGTLGGLKLTEKAEVQKGSTNPTVIKGLYACGEIGGNIAYTGYTWDVGLNFNVEASVGDIAGTEALKYARGE